MKEFLVIPIDPNGYEIDSKFAYQQLAYYASEAAGRLALQYPDKEILVVWPVKND